MMRPFVEAFAALAFLTLLNANYGLVERGMVAGPTRARRRHRGPIMAVRAKELRERVRRRIAGDAKVSLSPKVFQRQKRERREKLREEGMGAGGHLLRLQQDSAFYIGVLGRVGRKERAAAITAIERTLTCAGLKASDRFVRADVRVVDVGAEPIAEAAERVPAAFARLRRVNLLVHVVRCQDVRRHRGDSVAASDSDGDTAKEDAGAAAEEKAAPDATVTEESPVGADESGGSVLPATPLTDILATRAAMAYADLQIIEERREMNHTRNFWASRARAFNEIAALRILEPAFERVYVKGGVLRPAGHLFGSTLLKDGPRKRRDRVRWAIEPLGFLTCKHVLYAATLPLGRGPFDVTAAPAAAAAASAASDDVTGAVGSAKAGSADAEGTASGRRSGTAGDGSTSAGSNSVAVATITIAGEAAAQPDDGRGVTAPADAAELQPPADGTEELWGTGEVLAMARQHGVPAIAVDLWGRAGADALGEKVLSVLPRHVLERAKPQNASKKRLAGIGGGDGAAANAGVAARGKWIRVGAGGIAIVGGGPPSPPAPAGA